MGRGIREKVSYSLSLSLTLAQVTMKGKGHEMTILYV